MMEEKQAEEHKPRAPRVDIYWTTVTYKTVFVYGALALGVILVVVTLLNPDWLTNLARRISSAMAGTSGGVAVPAVNQARFVNLDGRVQVKKVDSVQWVAADYRMTLDKGDLIQTGSDGVARITFADGTTYTVKPDTLITVEENQMGQDRATRVGVHISSGAVDLATGSWDVPGSKAEVSFENAVASLRENSRAAVRSDPERKQHEITVARGAAEMQRGGQSITLGQWEKASFPTGGAVSKTRVLAPPELALPINLQPIIVPDPRRTAVQFAWRPVPGAAAYHLRVSTSSMFSQLVHDRRYASNTAAVAGFDAGDYFWAVTALDEQNRSSEPSDTYKFTLAAQGKGQEMLLEVEGTQLHGNVVEIIGRTEPGAALIINGQTVSNIQPDGRFRHFTQPMGRGAQTIVISGQNRRGGIATKRVPIVIP
jgi:hypothetical protein